MHNRRCLYLALLWTLALGPVAPAQPADGRPLLEHPLPQPQLGSWQLRWSSVAGRSYRLQRSHDLRDWTEVLTTQAEGATTTALDAGAPETQRTFWRVIQLGDGPDLAPPFLSGLQVRAVERAGQAKLELSVLAQDNVGVVRVEFFEAGKDWIEATPGPAGRFIHLADLDPSALDPRPFQARATDAAGNVGFSEVVTFVPVPPAPGLVAVDLDGNPLPQGFVGQRTDGTLTPFVYVPDHRGGALPAASPQLVFPEGGRLVQQNGQRYVEYRSLRFRFSRASALQLALPTPSVPGAAGLTRSGARFAAPGSTAADFLAIDLPEGQSALLPLGPLTVAQLESAFGLAPGTGLPVKLFDRFPLRLVEGLIKDHGIEGARWALDQLGLPLPDFTGDWVGGLFDLAAGECGRFPLYGEFPLPELGEINATLKTTREKPLVLRLCPDGEMALSGPAALEFSNGARLTVDVTLDDPVYRLRLAAESVTLPVAGALALVLPDNPENCLPPGATDAELDVAASCLHSFRRAYLRFAQTAVAGRPNDAPSLNQPEPPSALDTAGAIAEAWAASALTPLLTALPLEPMRELARNLGRSASGASDFKSAADSLRELVRLKAALDAYATQQLAGNDPALPDLQDEIDAALEEATAAAIARSRDPEALSSLECLRSALTTLVDVWALRQLLGNDNEAGLQTAIHELVTTYYTRFVASLGIAPGEFNHANNPVIAGLNRFTALEHVRTLVSLLGDGALLGVDTDAFARVEETRRQLFGRAFAIVEANLNDALANDNALAALLGLGELLDLLADWAIMGGTAVPGFPTLADAGARAAQLGALLDQEALLPRAETSLFNAAQRVRTLLAIVGQIPPSTTTLFAAIERAHDELRQTLAEAVLTAPTSDRVQDLLELLRAGAASMRLARQFPELAVTLDWEGTHLPAVVDRLGQLAENTLLWSQLDDAIAMLLEESAQLDLDAVRHPAFAGQIHLARQRYQTQAAALLARQYNVALELWNQTDALREANPDFFAADAFFPGDLKIDKLHGSLAYHRTQRLLSGAFGGELRLPRINSFLTVPNASINSRGEFDLSAYGQLSLPGGTNSTVVVTVPKRQPWHVSWKRNTGLAVAGKTRFTFASGIFFEAGASLRDPLYAFDLAAGGLERDTAETLTELLPLGLTLEDLENLARASLWNEYFALLGQCVEMGYRPEDESLTPAPGSLPAFAGTLGADAYCLLDAWTCLMLAEAERGNLAAYQSTYEKIGLLLGLVDSGLQEALGGLDAWFDPTAEFEIGFHLQRLTRITLTYEKISRVLARLAEANLLGNTSELQPDRLRAYLDNATVLWRRVVNRLSDNPVFLRDRNLTGPVVRAGLDLVASYAVLGLDEGALLDLSEVTAFLVTAADAWVASAGLNRQTGQLDGALIATFSYDQAQDRLRQYLDVEAELALAGITSTPSQSLLGALLDQMRNRALQAIGFNPANATYFPATVADRVAQRGLAQLVEVADLRALLGLNSLSLPAGFSGAAVSLHSRFVERARELPLSRWQARYAFVQSLHEIDHLLLLLGQAPLDAPATYEQLLSAFDQMARVARGRLTPAELALMRAVGDWLGDPALRSLYENRLDRAAATVETLASQPWPTRELSSATGSFEELLALEELRRRHSAITLAASRQPFVLLPASVDRLIVLAETEQRGQPLSDVAALLGEAIGRETQDDAFRLLLMSERVKLLNAARLIATGYRELIAEAGPDDGPADFHLPESLLVRRVFGSVFYDRSTAFLRGTFGGRLEFPNEKAFFDITSATLDSNGAFTLAANTRFPLRPTDEDQIEITASANVAGSPAGLASFTGTGQLAVKESPTLTQTYNVALSYDGSLPHRPLRFTAALDGVQNAGSLRFSDDFVLFNGNLTAELSLANQGEFAFGFGGRAGFFARTQPLAEPVQKEAFHVFAEIDQLTVRHREQALVATFSGGSLTLAEDLFKALEELPGGDLLPTDEPVTIPISFAFSVGYDFAQGRPIFSAGDGATQTVATAVGLAAPQPPQPVRFDLPPLAFGIPGLDGTRVTVTRCQLEFFEDRFPLLRDLEADFAFPLPGTDFSDPTQDRIVELNLTGQNWRVDGFPDAAAIALGQDLRLLELDGFALDLLADTGLSFASTVDANAQRTTTLTLEGGVRGTFDGDLLFDPDTEAAFAFATSGTFRWDLVQVPTFELGTVTFASRLKLGGPDGFALLGVDANGIPDPDNPDSLASVTLEGLSNLFRLAPDRPFEIRLSGALGSAQFAYFGLQNARFLFDGIATPPNPEPQFSVQSVGFREGEQLRLLGQELLPFRLTAGSLAFANPALPLDQLFVPENLIFTVSGEIDLSLASPDTSSTDLPRLFGAVEDVRISLPQGFAGPPTFSLDTFVLLLENLSIGDLAGLTGGLAVGNLSNPSQLFFAGTVGGGFNGVAIKAIVATRLDGLIGLCLDVNAGPAGIPLDGGSLGGILLTGAQGGVSFANQFADPCDFKSYLQLSSSGTPTDGATNTATSAAIALAAPARPVIPVSHLRVLPWAELAHLQALHEHETTLRHSLAPALRDLVVRASPESVVRASSLHSQDSSSLGTAAEARETSPALAGEGAGADVPCPTGDCPPPTINLLCQRHPSVDEPPSADNYDGAYRETVIFKFTSLDRSTVDELLASANLDLEGDAATVGGRFADAVQAMIGNLIPPVPDAVPLEQRQQFETFIANGLAAMRDALAISSRLALEAAAGQGRTPLEALYEAAYAGVTCLDITLQLKGTFSYSPISVALSATGGAVVSTTGSAGVLGSINLFGIPVGTGEFFYSITDTAGQPNPSLCGGARLALGPLEAGHLNFAIECTDCVTGTLEALAGFVAGLTGDILNDATPILYAFIEHAAGARLANLRNQPLTAFFGPPESGALLTQEEQVAVLAALMNLPELARFLAAHPDAITDFNQNALAALAARSVLLTLDIYNRVEPRLAICGEAEPKLFGFSLTGGNTLGAARFYADKTNLRGDVSFSPSYVFGNLPFMLLSSGSLANVVPAIDEATLGFSLGLPLFNQTVLELLAQDPAAFAATQLDHLLANAILTFGYELSPFGFKLADGEGRVALPTVEDHPDNPTRRAARPNDYVQGRFVAPAFPDRVTLLKAALDANVLAQATWDGRDGALAELFPANSPEAAALAGRELARDYFPHGGFLGASKVQLPKPITDAPPFDQFNLLFAEDTDLLERFTVAQTLFNEYLLSSREIGELMVYVPFANPPSVFWSAAQGPAAFIQAIAALTPERLLQEGLDLYPADQFFMRGAVNAQILGLPVGEGELIADPAQGLFRLTAGVPTGTWLTNFVQGNLTFEIRSAEYIAETDPGQLPPGLTPADLEPAARLEAARQLLELAAQPGVGNPEKQAAIATVLDRITDTLPKVSLATDLNLAVPPHLSSVLAFNSGAGFHAFSPRFEPGYGLPGYTGPIVYPDPAPNQPGPYTLARRHGGVVAVGNFRFGFNLDDPDPTRRFVIDVPEAALAVQGTADSSLFPALSGRVRINDLTLPGSFQFGDASTPPLQFKNGLLAFNSAPGLDEDYLAVEGQLTPITLDPFLRVRPLAAAANPENLLGGTLRVTRTSAGERLSIRLNPAAVSLPMLGARLRGIIYGSEPRPGTFTPFTFSTTPGQSWEAALRVTGPLEIRSPLDPNGPVVFRAEPLRVNGQLQPFEAEIAGVGLEQFELRVTIPNGLAFTLFPGTDQEGRFVTGSNSSTCLFVRSDGRLYFDSGTRTLDLNGLATVTGRIEFGFEPADRAPSLTHGRLTAFTASLGGSQLQTLEVTNGNRQGGQLVVDASLDDPTHFTVQPSRLVLGPAATGSLQVRFTPRSNGTFTPRLQLANNSTYPLIAVPLTGQVLTAPKLHVDLAAIDFGLTPLGTTRTRAVRLSNLGDAPLAITSAVAGNGFTREPATLQLAPGAVADGLVHFAPTSTATANGTLTFTSNDPSAPTRAISLRGTGSNRFWYHQRRGHGLEDLRAITIQPDGTGFAAGARGAFFRTASVGRIWQEDFLDGAPHLEALRFADANLGWAVGSMGRVYRSANGGNSWILQSTPALADPAVHWRAATVPNPASPFIALAGGREQRAHILMQSGASSFDVPVMPDSAGPLSGIAFGTSTTGLAVGENATLLRTTDGGKTWQLRPLPNQVPKETHLRAVTVHTSNASVYLVAGDNGLLLGSLDAGTTWNVLPSPTTQHLHAVLHTTTGFYAVGDNGTVLRSINGTTWQFEDALTTAHLRGLTTRAGEVWAVSTQGDILHRRTTAISGPLAVVATSDLAFGPVGIGERVVGEVWIANEGTAPLTLGLTSTDPRFQVQPDQSQNLPPGARTLATVSFESANGGAFGTDLEITSSDAALSKTALTTSATARHPEFSALPYAVLPAFLDLGTLRRGVPREVVIPVENRGQAPLEFHAITLRSADPTLRISGEPKVPASLAPGERQDLVVPLLATAAGTYRVQVEIASNARNGLAAVELLAIVPVDPEVVRIDSAPRGLTFQIDGVAFQTPAAFTLSEGPPGAGQLRRGSQVTVVAPTTATRDGVPYSFQRWEPGSRPALTFTAGRSTSSFTARYAPSLPAIKLTQPPEAQGRCDFTPPRDVAFGPWARLSDARLTLPWLSDGTAGSDFEVQGALFLSLTRAYGSLLSSRIRVLVPNNAPAFPGTELVEVTPGSWSFDLEAGFFQLAALAPGLQVLNQPTLPPAELGIEVDVRQAPANRRAHLRFATLEDLALAPALLAMGPASADLEIRLNPTQPGVRLALDGRLRALTRPTGGWIFDRDYSLLLDPELPTIAPLTFATRTQLADLALLRVHAEAGAQFGPTFDGTRFGLVAQGLALEFFRNNQPVVANATFGDDGAVAFSATFPQGIATGPLRLVPHPAGTGQLQAAIAPLEGRLAVQFPRVWAYSTAATPLWPDNTLELPAFGFDTADFAVRVPLPSVNFAQLPLTGTAAADADNHFEFSRSPAATRFTLRHRQDLVLGSLQLGLTASTASGLSGHLAGRLGLEEPPPLNLVSDRVSMTYRASPAPQFVYHRFFLGAATRLQWGSDHPLGQACLLKDEPNVPLSERGELLCFP
ncbi:MAG: choice-of-anchor D domain-containing protein [Verrucomicrobiales bacterium]|nr:choice-of-anchor D domain-containing protein [Verrucomicrobiales bacterium]